MLTVPNCSSGGVLGSNSGNVLEERDLRFDAIWWVETRSKPGSKLEMREVSFHEKLPNYSN